jgi:Flp pilus assembly protein TadG
VTRRSSGRLRGSGGSAAVEFALVLPLLLVVGLALLQVGLLVKDGLIVQEVARAGARQASVSADDQSVRSAAIDAAVSLDPSALDIGVARDRGTGSPVMVTVAYSATVTIPLVRWLFPDDVRLSAKATMRQESEP